MKKIFDSVTEMVGATPMLRMHRLTAAHDVKAVILAKCEMYNPLFSVKDRVALRMIEAAEKQGLIDDETILMEATSGNTGIGLAAISAAKGYKLVICMPENMSKERIALMQHLGAEVILTPKEDGMKGALAKADMLAEKNPHVLILSQFSNQANPDAHRFGTSMEIMEQTGGEVDVLVCAVGTSGTLTGTASTLRTSNPDLYVVAVEPKSSAVLSGGEAGPHNIPGIGAGFVPPLYEKNLVNEILAVSDKEAIDTAKETARLEGLPVGISGGAALAAAIKVGQRADFKGKQIVVILPDAAERYLSLGFFD